MSVVHSYAYRRPKDVAIEKAARRLLGALERQRGARESLNVREARAALRELLPVTIDPRDEAE